MSSSLRSKIHLIFALVLSLLAQGILFVPERLSFFLQDLPPWGSVAFGATLFVLSMYLYISRIRTISIKNPPGWHSNEFLLAVQALSVIGLIFILRSNAL